jgi:DNA-binding XRE family transcriptional regulator
MTRAARRTLAREVAAYRAAHGLSRAEMGRVMGVSLRTVVNMETGTRGLAPRTIRAWGRLREAWRATVEHGAQPETQPADMPDDHTPPMGDNGQISEEEL